MTRLFPILILRMLLVFELVGVKSVMSIDSSAPTPRSPLPSGVSSNSTINPVPIPPGPFDLQTCFELAVLQSETLGMKEEDIRIAQARYWQAIGATLPKVHVVSSESLQNNAGHFFGDNLGTKDQFSSRLNIKQPLFSGLRDPALAAAYKADTEARRYDKKRSLQLLYLDVTDIFYQILMYEKDLAILDEIQSTLKDRTQELQRRVHLGKSRKSELLAAQSEQSDWQVTVEQVRGLLGASQEMFSFLTGLPHSQIRLQDTQKLPTAESLENYLLETGERPDILAAIQSERSARKQWSAAKGEHWPTISVEGNYYLKQQPDSSREWNLLLTCDIPLFEGGMIESRVQERKAFWHWSQLNLEQLRRSADREVRTAYNNFISSMAQWTRLRETESVASRTFKLQQEDYQRGVTSNLDVLDSLRRLHDIRRRLSDEEMNAHVELIRLHVAAGKVEK